ncbi:MAG: MOSC domain-containing protein [Acidimicrobiales bacterium]
MASARCELCGFSASDWNAPDAAATFRHLATWWEAVDPSRPLPDSDAWLDRSRTLGTVDALFADTLIDLHIELHEISVAARQRHQVGRGAPHQTGVVEAINASAGGVPKRPMLEAEVTYGGVVGDKQAARQHHGRPWQALCLWSTDVIARLRSEGHPIEWGSAGENLSVSGLDWSTINPGVRVLAGDVLAEVSLWAVPCAKNSQWFVDGDFNRMAHEREPGISRMYAAVLRPGRVRPGDAFIVEPD